MHKPTASPTTRAELVQSTDLTIAFGLGKQLMHMLLTTVSRIDHGDEIGETLMRAISGHISFTRMQNGLLLAVYRNIVTTPIASYSSESTNLGSTRLSTAERTRSRARRGLAVSHCVQRSPRHRLRTAISPHAPQSTTWTYQVMFNSPEDLPYLALASFNHDPPSHPPNFTRPVWCICRTAKDAHNFATYVTLRISSDLSSPYTRSLMLPMKWAMLTCKCIR
jgi:hypothetical protein